MNYIINPFLIYLLEFVDLFIGIMIFFSLAFGIASIIFYFIKEEIDEKEERRKWANERFKGFSKVFYIALFFAVFVPNKETIIKMYVASIVTEENIARAVDVGKDAAEWTKETIIDIINTIKEEPEKGMEKQNELSSKENGCN